MIFAETLAKVKEFAINNNQKGLISVCNDWNHEAIELYQKWQGITNTNEQTITVKIEQLIAEALKYVHPTNNIDTSYLEYANSIINQLDTILSSNEAMQLPQEQRERYIKQAIQLRNELINSNNLITEITEVSGISR